VNVKGKDFTNHDIDFLVSSPLEISTTRNTQIELQLLSFLTIADNYVCTATHPFLSF
jgi:hypothetical protein